MPAGGSHRCTTENGLQYFFANKPFTSTSLLFVPVLTIITSILENKMYAFYEIGKQVPIELLNVQIPILACFTGK